jgi:protein involved in polysaccharide export with SLBB domain
MLLLVGIAIGALHPSGSEAQSAAGSPAGAARDTFGIQPGDLVRLKVWREPDMSGDVVIDAAGDATLPNRRESREPESPVQSFAANADVSG